MSILLFYIHIIDIILLAYSFCVFVSLSASVRVLVCVCVCVLRLEVIQYVVITENAYTNSKHKRLTNAFIGAL